MKDENEEGFNGKVRNIDRLTYPELVDELVKYYSPVHIYKYMDKILGEVRREREKQEEKWGQQNHPILDPMLLDRPARRMCEEYEIPTEDRARQVVETHAERGTLTYMHILQEEISEAVSCGSNTVELRKELIQCAAVLVAMIESLDRNGK